MTVFKRGDWPNLGNKRSDITRAVIGWKSVLYESIDGVFILFSLYTKNGLYSFSIFFKQSMYLNKDTEFHIYPK